MKYLVRFVTYNTFEVEADDADKACDIALEHYSNLADPSWDNVEVVESTEQTRHDDKACWITQIGDCGHAKIYR